MPSNSPFVWASRLGRLFFGLLLFMGLAVQVGWAQAPPEIEATLNKMLVATEDRSLDAFVANGDASFRADISPAMFNSFSAQFGPRLKRGYTTTFLTRLHQEGYAIYVWKVEFKDGGDDMLFTVAVKDGRVGGFSLR